MSELTLDPARSALLVMDFQTPIVARYADAQDTLLATTAGVVAAARRSGLRVIYVVVGFREGCPEISPRNAIFSRIRESGGIASDVHRRVAPEAGEPVVTKHRVGAFMGTDLEMILRANGVDTLVMGGIATSGVVLSTLRHAADADYRLVVVRDCCADNDPDVHACLMDKVFPRQATVVSAAELQRAL